MERKATKCRRSTRLPAARRTALAHYQHRDLRVRQNARGLAAEDQAAKAAAPMRGDDDRVALPRARGLENALPRLRIAHRARLAANARGLRFALDHGERLLGMRVHGLLVLTRIRG